MKIVFILYKPGVPGNVGSSARALKTMGFDELRLIEPCDYLSTEARMLAHGSIDILENAKIFKSVDDAVEDIDFLVATTAKRRVVKKDYLTPAMLKEQLSSKEELINRVGVIFGTEESGLPNMIIKNSDLASTIPLNNLYPSLNLSQAVMLYAYELSELKNVRESRGKSSQENIGEIKRNVSALLVKAGIPEQMPLYHRILERVSFLSSGDLKLMQSVVSRLLKKILLLDE